MNRDIRALQLVCVLVATIIVIVVLRGALGLDNNTKVGSNDKETTSLLKLDNPEKITGEDIQNLDEILATVTNETYIDQSKLLTADNQKADLEINKGVGHQVSDDTKKDETNYKSSYDFSEKMYPYRAMLNSSEANAYDQIYEGITQLKESISLSADINTDQIKNVMLAVFCDHPELFYIDTKYNYNYTSTKKVIAVSPEYNATAANLINSRQKFYHAVAEIINEAQGLKTDIEKEQLVYKRIQEICTYVNDSDMNQSAYSAMVNKQSVCAGYSRAFQYILQQLNIPCYFCLGVVGSGNHAWNIVFIDGNYYNVDLSWDDALSELTNGTSYTYFNISDTAISLDHARRDLSIKLPECKNTLKTE